MIKRLGAAGAAAAIATMGLLATGSPAQATTDGSTMRPAHQGVRTTLDGAQLRPAHQPL